jgi:imidazolonepropionase-like amidohydrolase
MFKGIYILQILAAAFLLSCAFNVHAQNPKGKYGTFALTNATIVPVHGETITSGTVVIHNGIIQEVGTDVTIPAHAQVIDCTGKFIYPGFIDGGTTLGIQEVASDPRTNDNVEVGDVIPQVRALVAVNPNSVLIPVTRVSGVTSVITMPGGTLLPGTAALIDLYGYTPDQMFAGFEGVMLKFPAIEKRGYFDRRSDEELKKDKEKRMTRLSEVWEKAIQYYKLDSASGTREVDYYPEMQALLPVVRGDRTLIIEVNAEKDIRAALQWVSERKLKKVILSGVAEGWRVANDIAKAEIPVITGPVMSLPSREYDRYDKPYSNAALMVNAGVKVALRTMQAENVRNLPFHAGFAAAYGLGKEEALRAVTITPAEIFGVADKMGSIERGKNASLFICDGDPFEPKTAILQVFINGWMIPMVNRQTQFYDEFLKREPGVAR